MSYTKNAVVIILPSLFKFGWMGSTKRFLTIYDSFKSNNYEVIVIAQKYENISTQSDLDSEFLSSGDTLRVGFPMWVYKLIRLPFRLFHKKTYEYMVSTLWSNTVDTSRLAERLRHSNVKVIWAMSGQSLDAANLANKLASKLKVNWVYELHDPPIGADIVFENNIITTAHENLLISANSIVTNAARYKDLIIEKYSVFPDKVYNFPLTFTDFKESNLTSVITLGYFGSLSGPRNVDLFAEALQDFYDTKTDLKFGFKLGGLGDGFQSLISGFKKDKRTNDSYEYYGLLDEKELGVHLASCDALIVMQAAQNDLQVPGKIFELLSYKKPIICITSDDTETGDIIAKSGLGIMVSPGNVSSFLSALHYLYNLKKGEVFTQPNEAFIRSFTQNHLENNVLKLVQKNLKR
jgi:glycosyltransferase involved in cell wall biosynthesis